MKLALLMFWISSIQTEMNETTEHGRTAATIIRWLVFALPNQWSVRVRPCPGVLSGIHCFCRGTVRRGKREKSNTPTYRITGEYRGRPLIGHGVPRKRERPSLLVRPSLQPCDEDQSAFSAHRRRACCSS